MRKTSHYSCSIKKNIPISCALSVHTIYITHMYYTYYWYYTNVIPVTYKMSLERTLISLDFAQKMGNWCSTLLKYSILSKNRVCTVLTYLSGLVSQVFFSLFLKDIVYLLQRVFFKPCNIFIFPLFFQFP